jgi:hypothetical protein
MPSREYSTMSVEELKKEIVRRQRALPQLIARREALDKLIVALQGLSDAHAAPKPLIRKLGKKRARRTQDGMRAGGLADKPSGAGKLAGVFQVKGIPSLAEMVFLGDRNRFRAALDVFKDGAALKLPDKNRDDHVGLGADREGPALARANQNAKANAALSRNRDRVLNLHLSDDHGENRAAPDVDKGGPVLTAADENNKTRPALSTDECGSKLHLADENRKVVWSAS